VGRKKENADPHMWSAGSGEQAMRDFDHVFEWAEPQGGRPDHHMGVNGVDHEQAPSVADQSPTSATPWKALLERVVETEVLPRLMLSHAPQPEPAVQKNPRHADPMTGHLDDFVSLLLEPEGDGALDYVASLRVGDEVKQSIFLDLLAPAAKRLGALWEDDHCDFMDVTIGLQRLQQILRILSPDRSALAGAAAFHKRALLLPTPGETHVFGVAIVETFLSDAGWDVAQSSETAFAETLASGWFDVVGFSLSQDRNIGRLQTAIAEARRRSMNPDLRVMVGGPVFLDNPKLVGEVGADAMATDAPSAVLWAENLLNRQILV
jgi:hypothetical protein